MGQWRRLGARTREWIPVYGSAVVDYSQFPEAADYTTGQKVFLAYQLASVCLLSIAVGAGVPYVTYKVLETF